MPSNSTALTLVTSLRMPPAIVPAAASFWTDHRDQISALATILISIGLAFLVDRALLRRSSRFANLVSPSGEISATTDTRLRMLRRLTFLGIVVIGVALGLTQFPAIKRTAAGVLASSAVVGLVIGFAARQTLANLIAGILLVITQPIRIGDLVTFEGNTGIVEDIRLTYTYVRAADNRRVIVPNERLAASTIENFTIIDPHVDVEVTLGLPIDADPNRAIEVLKDVGDAEIAAVEKDGYQVVVRTPAEHPDMRGDAAARIRAACVERLRRENILG